MDIHVESIYIGKQLPSCSAQGWPDFSSAKGILRNSLGLGTLEAIALLTPVGLGVVILLLFALGALGFLSPAPVLGGIGLLVALRCGASGPCSNSTSGRRWHPGSPPGACWRWSLRSSC